WIIQDGNYGDFQRYQKTRFALEFYPHNLRLIGAAEAMAERIEGSRYRVHAQVVCVLKGAWVVDFGVHAFQQSKPPKRVRKGDWISADIYVGIDPFFYFEDLVHLREMPPLIYGWFIRKIAIQTAPFIETV